MKRLVISVTFFLFVLGLILSNNSSYGYIDCFNNIIYPEGVNTLNMGYYFNNNIDNVKEICSYDRCLIIKDNNIISTIRDFNNIYNKYLNEEERLIIKVKGYPITKIVVNSC